MQDFLLDIDDAIDELYYEIEGMQDGYTSHKLVFTDESKEKAAARICMKLTGFFISHLKEAK